jgi:hypothetical protein
VTGPGAAAMKGASLTARIEIVTVATAEFARLSSTL